MAKEKRRTVRVIVLLTIEEKRDLKRKAKRYDDEMGATLREGLARLPTPRA